MPPKLLELKSQAIAAYKRKDFLTSKKLYHQVATKLSEKSKFVKEVFDNFLLFAVSCIKAEEELLEAFHLLYENIRLHKDDICRVLTAEVGI